MLTDEQKKQIEIQDRAIEANLDKIRFRIVVFSGKGGVGKTTISVNIAFGLHSDGYRTGILDADVTGPNVPKMLGLTGEFSARNERIIPQESNGVKVISIANMIPQDQPVIWRGPMRSKLLHQFLGSVEWGQLDFLIADLPPGTGDEIITLTQKMDPDLAIIVTTPQEVSLADSGRAVNLAKEMKIPRIGIIENMSGLTCPRCGYLIDLFGSGGGRRQAADMNVLLLGALPIDCEARTMSDKGKLFVLESTEANISIATLGVIRKIEKMFDEVGEKDSTMST